MLNTLAITQTISITISPPRPIFTFLLICFSLNTGAVLISARVVADVLPDNPNAAGVRAYFGDDAALYAQRSPLTHAEHIDVPLMVVVAEHENPYLDAYGSAFFERVAQARQRTGRPARAPRFLQMLRHNHTSVVAHFDSGETLLGDAMLDFFRA